jgi:hypothetical protein
VNGNVIRPVAAISVPPAPQPGTGNLIPSPKSAGPDLVNTTQTFTLQISGITYQTVQRLPLLEGSAGSNMISNTPNGLPLALPALPEGGTIDRRSP